MKKATIDLDELLGAGEQVEQLFRIIARRILLPMQIRVSDPGEGWAITMTIVDYGKYKHESNSEI